MKLFIFVIAHELRYIWQHETNHDLYYSDFFRSESNNTLEYNVQISEIDANAFASLVMDYFFDVVVTFDAFPEFVKELIFKMEDKIEPEFFDDF